MTRYVYGDEFKNESDLTSSVRTVLSDIGMSNIKTEVPIENLDFDNTSTPTVPSWKIDIVCTRNTGDKLLIECKSGRHPIRRSVGQAKSYSHTGYQTWIVVDSYNPFMLESLSNERFNVFFIHSNELKLIYQGTGEKVPADVKIETESTNKLVLEQMQQEIDELKNELDDKREEIYFKNNNIEVLKDKIESKNDKIEKHDHVVKDKERKIERLNDVNSKLKDEIAELEPMEWINERSRMKSKLEQLRKRVNELEKQT